MERLILVRHAESEYSARGLLNADPRVPVALTAQGREQARRLGRRLAGVEIDLCVTTELLRTRETAELALAGRTIPTIAIADLNDHPAGEYEGRPLSEYLVWAHGAGAGDPIPGAGLSRAQVAASFARGFRVVLARPERTILAVLHSLPIVYLLGAAEGRDPERELPLLAYAEPHTLGAAEMEGAVARLERWSAAPAW